MRLSALLLGVLPTAGAIYVAHIAVTSAGVERRAGPARDDRDRPAPDQLWYGGVLDPVIVEARRALPPALASRDTVNMQCADTTHRKYHPTSFDEVRKPIGVVM